MSDAPLPLIALHQVHKRFDGGARSVVRRVAQRRAGEFVALLGPSGCGKRTVLRLAAGLATSGDAR